MVAASRFEINRRRVLLYGISGVMLLTLAIMIGNLDPIIGYYTTVIVHDLWSIHTK